jgi:hypothetical protein
MAICTGEDVSACGSGDTDCGTPLQRDGQLLWIGGPCHSGTFEIRDKEILILRMFGATPCAKVLIDQVWGCDGGQFFEPLYVCGSECSCDCDCICEPPKVTLSAYNNALTLTMPGRYRIRWADCDHMEGYVVATKATTQGFTVALPHCTTSPCGLPDVGALT